MPDDIIRYFKIIGRDIVYLKFILEAYEGMVTMSTVDQKNGVIRLIIPYPFRDDIDQLISSLKGEISLEEQKQETYAR